MHFTVGFFATMGLKTSRILFALLMMNFSVQTQGHSGNSPEPGCEFPDSVRHSRPGLGQDATEIRVGAYLVDIPKIDDTDQSYVADIFLRYEWKIAATGSSSIHLERMKVRREYGVSSLC